MSDWKIYWLKSFAKQDKKHFLSQMLPLIERFVEDKSFWSQLITIEEVFDGGAKATVTYHPCSQRYCLKNLSNTRITIAYWGKFGISELAEIVATRELKNLC
jgi:hypothetical protein